MYGPTETTIWSSVDRVEAGKPVVIGSPIANTTFYVLDACRELVPIGVPGELYIGGDGLAEGYLKRPDLTAERFVRDPFGAKPESRLYRTGDVVRRLSDGRIEFLHRIDQQVKIRGFRIELEEGEAALKQHPGVAQCVTIAREDVPGDKRLVAYIVLRDPGVVLAIPELRNFLKQKLPDYMIPVTFVALKELPLTLNGKLDRKALPLPGLSLARSSPARQIVPPRTTLEVELVRIWEQALGTKITSVRDNFFDLGGHSLLAVRMFAQIEKVFKVRLPLATLYQAPAIEDMARILSDEVIFSRWSSLVAIQASGSRAPFFCFHGGGGNVLIYRKLAQYLGPDQPFYGLQSQGLDGSSPLLGTIEEMAALYVEEIRGVQPHGPYLLGGYCLGGAIAYEAAQQLHAAGEQVALLALFDTMNWRNAMLTSWDRKLLRLQRLIFHTAVLFKVDLGAKRKFLKGKFHDLRSRIPVWWGMLLSKFKRGSDGSVSGSLALAQVWRGNHRASRHYVPKPYPGVVTDFRPARQYSVLNRPNLKWDQLARGGQRVVVVPGYPAVMLIEPYVKDLAGMLAASIEDAVQHGKLSESQDIPVPAQAVVSIIS
jgi:thioesterase domain-containing protein/acyl carrier protein